MLPTMVPSQEHMCPCLTNHTLRSSKFEFCSASSVGSQGSVIAVALYFIEYVYLFQYKEPVQKFCVPSMQ